MDSSKWLDFDKSIGATSHAVAEPERIDAFIVPAPERPTCRVCGSPDCWQLDLYLSGSWYCRKCGVVPPVKPEHRIARVAK